MPGIQVGPILTTRFKIYINPKNEEETGWLIDDKVQV
jgi:hypothetical protein